MRELEQADLQRRVAMLPVTQNRRQDSQRRRAGDRHLQLAYLEIERPADRPASALSVGEGGSRFAKQLLSCRGQADPARKALQQRSAQLGLQRADLL